MFSLRWGQFWSSLRSCSFYPRRGVWRSHKEETIDRRAFRTREQPRAQWGRVSEQQRAAGASERARACVAEAGGVGVLSCARHSDARCRCGARSTALMRVLLARSARRCVRELRAIYPRYLRAAANAPVRARVRCSPRGACAMRRERRHIAARGRDSRDHHRGRASVSACVFDSERKPDSSDRARLGAGPPRLSRPVTRVHRHAPRGEGETAGYFFQKQNKWRYPLFYQAHILLKRFCFKCPPMEQSTTKVSMR